MAEDQPDPPSDLDETLGADELPTLEADGSRAPAAPPTQLPESIGQYRILGKLGEGGMGTVFEAEQPHPRRRVALKVIRSGQLVSELEVRMFQREADSLARLKHPSIGGIYEAGRTEGGQHFFAMELVRGETLDKYLRKRHRPLDRREVEYRLWLFREICDAVHYAHQRGVIHRDLKPSNVIVLEGEAAEGSGSRISSIPGIKILDFGLARITDTDVAAATVVSEVGMIQGTLPYMSPEQARGRPEEIDLRSDVYALGVILYEMLAGAYPYETAKSSIIEAVRIICEEPPKPLKQAWSGVQRLDDDLETIVGKALEKDPELRYASAAALSDDVERYLTSQPIQARPPSTIYQLKKLVARNKLPSAFVAAILLLIVGFGAWMTVLYRRALAAEAEAQQEAQTTLQVSDFMVDLFEVSDPSESRGNTITAREILDSAAERIETELADQPVVRARLLHTVGKVYRSLGLLQPAGELLGKAVFLREEVLGPEHPEVARSLVEMGAGEATLAAYEEAQEHLERALAIQRGDPGVEETEVAETLRHLAFLHREQGKWDEAADIYEKLVPLQERLLGPDDPQLATTLEELGRFYHQLSRFEEFEEIEERAFAIREKILGPDHPDLGASLHELADAYSHTGKPELRLVAAERGLAIREKALGAYHPDVAFALHGLGNAYMAVDRLAEAEAAYRRALEIGEKLGATQHPRYGVALASLAQVYNAQDRYLEAVPLLQQSLTIQERGFGPDSPNLVRALSQLGHAYFYAGLPDRARPPLERSFAIATALGPDHAELALAAFLLASVNRDQGRLPEAENLYAQALGIQESRPPENDHLLGDILLEQGILFRMQGRFGEAEASLGRSQDVFEQFLGPDDHHVAEALHEQAVLLRLQGQPEGARPLLERALAIRQGTYGPQHALTRETQEALASLGGD